MKKGFTLVEIIAVLVIISVLVVIATPRFLDMLESSRKQSRTKIYEMIESSARLYCNDYKISNLGEIINISTLCERDYLDCPMYDPLTEKEINGYIKIELDPKYNTVKRYVYYEE